MTRRDANVLGRSVDCERIGAETCETLLQLKAGLDERNDDIRQLT